MKSLHRFARHALLKSCLIATLPVSGSFANTCNMGDTTAGLLPRFVGSPRRDRVVPFAAPCDTIHVRRGDTCTLYPGTFLHFPREFAARVLVVDGLLRIEGSPSLPVLMAGTIDDTGSTLLPGDAAWRGIRVREGGALLARHALLARADTALDLRSRHIWVDSVRFQDCRVVLDSARRAYAVSPDRPFILHEDASLLGTTSRSVAFWKRPSTYLWSGGAAVGALAAYFLWAPGESSSSSPTPPVDQRDAFDTPPNLPPNPSPR